MRLRLIFVTLLLLIPACKKRQQTVEIDRDGLTHRSPTASDSLRRRSPDPDSLDAVTKTRMDRSRKELDRIDQSISQKEKELDAASTPAEKEKISQDLDKLQNDRGEAREELDGLLEDLSGKSPGDEKSTPAGPDVDEHQSGYKLGLQRGKRHKQAGRINNPWCLSLSKDYCDGYKEGYSKGYDETASPADRERSAGHEAAGRARLEAAENRAYLQVCRHFPPCEAPFLTWSARWESIDQCPPDQSTAFCEGWAAGYAETDENQATLQGTRTGESDYRDGLVTAWQEATGAEEPASDDEYEALQLWWEENACLPALNHLVTCPKAGSGSGQAAL